MALTIAQSNLSPIKVTGTTAVSEAIATGRFKISHLYWHKPTTQNHLCELQDGGGDVIAVLECETANESILLPILATYEDIKCDNMDSGTLYIYLDRLRRR